MSPIVPLVVTIFGCLWVLGIGVIRQMSGSNDTNVISLLVSPAVFVYAMGATLVDALTGQLGE